MEEHGATCFKSLIAWRELLHLLYPSHQQKGSEDTNQRYKGFPLIYSLNHLLIYNQPIREHLERSTQMDTYRPVRKEHHDKLKELKPQQLNESYKDQLKSYGMDNV